MEAKALVLVLIAALFLYTPAPEIGTISPNSGLNNETVEVIIEGAKFNDKTAVKLVKSGEEDLTAANLKIDSKKRIRCTFNLQGRAVGKWNVVVVNTTKIAEKEKTATLIDGFTIEYPEPTITGVDPGKGLNSEILTLNLSGSHFRSGAKVELCAGDQKILANNVEVLSGSKLTAEFDLVGSVPGTYDLKVTNDDGKAGVLTGGFEILERCLAEPAISEIIPQEGLNNSWISIAIHGENFDPGAAVKLVGSEGDEIVGVDINVKNAREISGDFDLNGQTAGSYDVVVINPNEKEAVLSGGFRVKEADDEAVGKVTFLKPIFFDFDRSVIRPDQIGTLEENLGYLIENPELYILLGGHADERGPREYNIGLSQRRAEAVQEFIVSKGVDPERVMIYAYGEDYPAKKGHDEESWSYNRRVDILVGKEKPGWEQGIIEVKNREGESDGYLSE